MRKILIINCLCMFATFCLNAQTNTFPSSGNVGIGTPNPLARLHVFNGNNSYGTILANANEIAFSLYSKTLTTQIVNGEAFRLGLKYNNDENNGFISFHRGYDTSGGFLGFSTNGIERIRIDAQGKVGIGTLTPDSKLTVAGKIHSQEVKVTINAGADFVFNDDYILPSLESVEKFIAENKHLPEIASEQEMQENGLLLADMNIKLLQKIEELTLYVIEQEKRMDALETENKTLKTQEDRIAELEEKIALLLNKN